MSTRHRPALARTQGIALVVVLWIVVVLAILGGTFLSAMRAEMRMAHNLLASVQARLLAEAGFNRAVYELYRQDPAQRPIADGTLHDFAVPGAVIRFSLLDENAKIDLNKAPRELLAGLFAALDMDADARAGLPDAIVDWRDSDTARQLLGAEDPDYLAAGFAYGAKDAPFDTVEELLLLPGMTHGIFMQLAPFLTVDSGQSGIDPTLAPAQVLAALPGMTPDMAHAYRQARQAFREANRVPPLPQAIDGRYVTNGRGVIYSIFSSATLERGGTAAIETTVRIQRNRPDMPIAIQRWSEIDSLDPATAKKGTDEDLR